MKWNLLTHGGGKQQLRSQVVTADAMSEVGERVYQSECERFVLLCRDSSTRPVYKFTTFIPFGFLGRKVVDPTARLRFSLITGVARSYTRFHDSERAAKAWVTKVSKATRMKVGGPFKRVLSVSSFIVDEWRVHERKLVAAENETPRFTVPEVLATRGTRAEAEAYLKAAAESDPHTVIDRSGWAVLPLAAQCVGLDPDAPIEIVADKIQDLTGVRVI